VDLSIEDNGPGMPEEVLARCTEPFFTTKSSGSGLGLALVRVLITGCGGVLGFQSPRPGKATGTVAVITLPVGSPR
jgi:signal transduction histidine kinase